MNITNTSTTQIEQIAKLNSRSAAEEQTPKKQSMAEKSTTEVSDLSKSIGSTFENLASQPDVERRGSARRARVAPRPASGSCGGGVARGHHAGSHVVVQHRCAGTISFSVFAKNHPPRVVRPVMLRMSWTDGDGCLRGAKLATAEAPAVRAEARHPGRRVCRACSATLGLASLDLRRRGQARQTVLENERKHKGTMGRKQYTRGAQTDSHSTPTTKVYT